MHVADNNTGWFEDFTPGQVLTSPAITITEAQIIDYAARFDPQPFHIDKVAAAQSIYGGLIASGWHVAAQAFRQFIGTNPFGTASLGSPGCDRLKWLRPVYAGDTIRTDVTVVECRPSRSKPDRGIVVMDYAVINQRGETAMQLQANQLLKRRPAGLETD